MIVHASHLQSISLSAIILAGGRSSRMGEDKALLPIQGVPLLHLVYDVASTLCDVVYVVTPWSERYQNFLPTSCHFVTETSPLQGPLAGFAQGLAEVKTDWVLLLACDLPRLRVEVLRDWVAELNLVGKEAIALLPHHARGWEPLCGFYRRECLDLIEDFIKQGGKSFQKWLALHPVQVLSLPNTQMLFNCNTQDDYATLTKLN